jgi:hypothetical protein
MSTVPSIIRKTLVKPPILVDEDPAEYRELFEAISNDERPQSLQEWLLVADIVNVAWEILRLSGLKVRALHSALLRTLIQDLSDGWMNYIDFTRPKPLWHAVFRRDIFGALAGDPAARLRIEKLLEPHGLTLDSVVASGFAQKISVQLSADRLLEAANRRRNALYADLERARSKSRRINNLPLVDAPSVAEGDGPNATPAEAPENADAGAPLLALPREQHS